MDLFRCHTWRAPVFGEICYRDKDVLVFGGALQKAITSGRPLVVYNPPDEAGFLQFVHQINHERKVLCNGSILEIPDGVYIITRSLEHDVKADNIHFLQESASNDNRQRIFISINNLHEIYKQLRIHTNRLAETIIGGLLRKYDRTSQVFYLVGDIPKSYWQAFVAHVKAYNPGFHVDIMLSPTARIEGVNETGAAVVLQSVPFQSLGSGVDNILACNDPDLVSEQLKSKLGHAEIVYVTPQTSFNDLIASIEHDTVDHTGFIYHEYSLFRALKEGLTIILNGEMSLTLYYQLQSLLSKDPHICLNGERQAAKGRLIAVLPLCAMETLPAVTQQCHLTPDDYTTVLSKLPYFDEDKFSAVKRFYDHIRLTEG